ncbi:50S ribosomal protein L4 [Candidatus Uhrbacteria bacterium]|nr:50S ribosomal protein L4 [Candidatus Uhrbacteria bacterium]
MTTAKVYNLAGGIVRDMELDPYVFGVPADEALLHFVVTASSANARRVIANTKTRAEVRGGGKKPWAQKGTGRARHGSSRSPIWIGGGVTFGPRSNRNYKEKINAKVMQKAMRMCLSLRAGEGKLLLVESWKLPAMKTKEVERVLSALQIPLAKKNAALLVADTQARTLIQAAKNIASLRTVGKENMSVIELLKYPYMIATPEVVTHLTSLYGKKQKMV